MYRAICSFVLALSLTLSSDTGALAQTRDTIRVTNGERPPFVSEHAPHYGFASHIITGAFALVDVDVEYGFFPWKRSYKLAKEGKWDGSSIWWENEERRRLFYFSDTYGSTKEAFFHIKTKAFDWTSYEDLRELRIGGTNPYDYGKAFNEAEAAGIIKVERAPNDETSLKKLLKGRLDVFPGTVMVTYEQIRQTFSDEEVALFTHHPKPIAERPVYLIFSRQVPGNEQMRDLFNEGLRMLKESGRWDQIIADALAGKYDAKQK